MRRQVNVEGGARMIENGTGIRGGWLARRAARRGRGASAQTLTDGITRITTLDDTGLDQPTRWPFSPRRPLVLESRRVRAARDQRRAAGRQRPRRNVNASSERGLLGIAINTESPPKVFLYYTEAMTTDAHRARQPRLPLHLELRHGHAGDPQMILDLPVTTGPNPDGGVIFLGADRRGIGRRRQLAVRDHRRPNRNGQLQNFSGGPAPDDTSVIFRVEQDGTAAAGNPFVPYCSVTTSQTCPGGGGCPGGETCRTQVARYYAYGVRNSFGMALDPVTGDLWDTENGPGNFDEINHVAPGFNSGWEPIMGPDALDPQGVGNLFNMPGAGLTYSDPEFSWFDTNAPTAIVFPSGSSLGTAYDDVALVGDSNNGNLYSFPLNPGRTGFDFSAFPDLQDLVADDVKRQKPGPAWPRLRARSPTSRSAPTTTSTFVSSSATIYGIEGPGAFGLRRRPRRRPTRRCHRPHADDHADRATVTPTVTPRPAAADAGRHAPRTPRSAALRFGGSAQLVLKDKDDTKDVRVKGSRARRPTRSSSAIRSRTHAYELCIYDGGGLVGVGVGSRGRRLRRQPVLEVDRKRIPLSRPAAHAHGLGTVVLRRARRAGPRSSCAARASTSTCRI